MHSRQLHIQRRLRPKRPHIQSVEPIRTVLLQLKVKVEDHFSQNDPHLCISQVLAETVARSEAERGEGSTIVVFVLRVAKPALWGVQFRVTEVGVGVIGGVLRDGDRGLDAG